MLSPSRPLHRTQSDRSDAEESSVHRVGFLVRGLAKVYGPTMRLQLVLVVLIILLGSTCAGGGENGSDAVSFGCDGLADRWITIQQGYLDELADADLAELGQRSFRVTTAESRLVQALIEQARDAQAVGCASDLESDSAALCTRLDRLAPPGAAGESVVELLLSDCSA